MKHLFPDLPYAYNALEPFMDEATMRIHHDKHHKTYFDKFLIALEKYPEGKEKTIEAILSHLNEVPEDARKAVKNMGGGHYHHTIFWLMMAPDGGGLPTGKIADAIQKTFGSFQAFKEQFNQQASILFGSGWTWLVKNKAGALSILNTSNQDCPLTDGAIPLLGLDIWEHAYYLNYQNRRLEYIDAFWNVVNWKYVEGVYNSVQ